MLKRIYNLEVVDAWHGIQTDSAARSTWLMSGTRSLSHSTRNLDEHECCVMAIRYHQWLPAWWAGRMKLLPLNSIHYRIPVLCRELRTLGKWANTLGKHFAEIRSRQRNAGKQATGKGSFAESRSRENCSRAHGVHLSANYSSRRTLTLVTWAHLSNSKT